MTRWFQVFRGFKGHPSHPPFTDFTIGAFTVATVLAVLGWLGLNESLMVRTAYLSVVTGLVFSALTILTGFLDYFQIPRGTPLRRTVAIHWVSMISSTSIYIAAAALLNGGYESGEVSIAAGLVTLVAWLTLAFGAWVGGSVVFVYGMRVLSEGDASSRDALKAKFPPD